LAVNAYEYKIALSQVDLIAPTYPEQLSVNNTAVARCVDKVTKYNFIKISFVEVHRTKNIYMIKYAYVFWSES
jgi:hypothetical protein